MTFSLFPTSHTNRFPQQNTLGLQNQLVQTVDRSTTKSPIAEKIEHFNSELAIYSLSPMHGQPQTLAKVNDQDFITFSKLTGREKVSDLSPTLKNHFHVVLRKINENKKHSIAIKTCLTEATEMEINEPMTNLLKIADNIAKLLNQISVVETDITTENDFLFKKIYEMGIIFNNYKEFVGNSVNMSNAVGQLGKLSYKECQTLINHVLTDYVDFKDNIIRGVKNDYEKLHEIYLQISGMVTLENSTDKSNIDKSLTTITKFIEEYGNIYNLLNTRINQLLEKNKTIKEKFVKILERTKSNYNSPFMEYDKKLKQIKQNFKDSVGLENIKHLLMNSKI